MAKTNLDKLSPLAFKVTQKAETEKPFSGEYNNYYAAGHYHCICCNQALFSSEHKYNSHSGWPSFFQASSQHAVRYKEDLSLFGKRTEVVCSNCQAHLGHIFNDGPQPTGKRYCINSASLQFIPSV